MENVSVRVRETLRCVIKEDDGTEYGFCVPAEEGEQTTFIYDSWKNIEAAILWCQQHNMFIQAFSLAREYVNLYVAKVVLDKYQANGSSEWQNVSPVSWVLSFDTVDCELYCAVFCANFVGSNSDLRGAMFGVAGN